ncbi:MAG: CDP-alcohol phosphatidyltransferase family protein [Pyrinomonas methylaliphatogenes]|jgi:cardiolipin synthase|nr:CDP-alcohol phosphatidyltransferase family protein [Pyrinomonas methylaliphatogenes]
MSARIVTLPNLLTVLRMMLIPVFVSLLFYKMYAWALFVFIIAGTTDGLDGLFARRFDQRSSLGTILDPIADKLLLVTSFVVLSMPNIYPQPLPRHLPIPFWTTALVISRDVFILVGAAAIHLVTGFRRFRPSWPGKLNTTIQILSIIYILSAAHLTTLTGYLPGVYSLVGASAFFSGIHYIFFASRLLAEERREFDL